MPKTYVNSLTLYVYWLYIFHRYIRLKSGSSSYRMLSCVIQSTKINFPQILVFSYCRFHINTKSIYMYSEQQLKAFRTKPSTHGILYKYVDIISIIQLISFFLLEKNQFSPVDCISYSEFSQSIIKTYIFAMNKVTFLSTIHFFFFCYFRHPKHPCHL